MAKISDKICAKMPHFTKKIEKIFKSKYFPILVLIIVQLIFNIFATDTYGDDPWFANALNYENYTANHSIFEYLSYRWTNWTARVLMEFLVVSVLQLNDIIWKVLNALLYGLITYSISRIFVKPDIEESKARKINIIICLLFMMIDLGVLAGAGYYTTFMFYLLPTALMFYAMIFARKLLLKEKVYKFEYPLFIISAIVASNMEQTCSVLLAVMGLTFLWNIIKNKKISIFNIILIAIPVIGMIVAGVCPGNDVRYEISIETSFPEYENFGTIEKVKMGIYSLAECCFKEFNLLYLVFTILVMIQIFRKYNNCFVKIIAIIPVFMGLAITAFSAVAESLYPNFNNWFNNYFANYNQLEVRWFDILPIIISFGCSVFSLLLIFKINIKTLILFITYMGGLASRFIMGFSPTVIVSGSRTATILLCAFIIMIVIILQEEDEKFIDKFLNTAAVLAVANFFERCSTLNLYNNMGKGN